MARRRLRGKKLLVATAGLATVAYMACKQEHPPGNLPAPPPQPIEHPPGNLPAPPPVEDDGQAPPDVIATSPTATATAPTTAPTGPLPEDHPPGNLPAPPPMETPEGQ